MIRRNRRVTPKLSDSSGLLRQTPIEMRTAVWHKRVIYKFVAMGGGNPVGKRRVGPFGNFPARPVACRTRVGWIQGRVVRAANPANREFFADTRRMSSAA